MALIGELSKEAFRCFDKSEHADSFLEGRIRFGSIYYFKNIERGYRRDQEEGVSSLVSGSSRHFAMFARTTPYIYCFHKTVAAAKNRQDSNHIVHIYNMRMFVERLGKAVAKSDLKCWGGLEGAFVIYNKGHSTDTNISPIDLARLAYIQKPENFRSEEEFRLIILLEKKSDDFLTIDIGDIRDIATIIHK